MSAHWFRCFACTKIQGQPNDFWSDKVQCPKCGAGRLAIIQLMTTHLIVADPAGKIGGEYGNRFRIVCRPDLVSVGVLHNTGENASGEPMPVNCPTCKASKEYQEQLERHPQQAEKLLMIEASCCG